MTKKKIKEACQKQYQEKVKIINKVNKKIEEMIEESKIKEELAKSNEFKNEMTKKSAEGIKLSNQIEEMGNILEKVKNSTIKKKTYRN